MTFDIKLLIASLILALAVWGCGRTAGPPTPAEEPPPILVAVAAVEQRTAIVEQTFVGTVVPLRTAIVASPAEGQVVEFLAHKGSFVKAAAQGGAVPLVRLRTKEAAIELAGAAAELELRQHELEELRLAAPHEIEQARAKKDAAEATMRFTQTRWKLTQELQVQGAASALEREEHRSAAEVAEKVFLERKAAWELASSGVWAEKAAAAQAKVEVQKRRIERLRADLAQREVLAPFDGYVTEEHLQVGEWVAQGGRIAEVVEIDDVYVDVQVSESCVAELRPGTTARVVIAALGADIFAGQVAAVVPKGDCQSRCFPVRVRLKNPASVTNPGQLLLKPGMFAEVKLPVRSKTMLSVPKDSLVLGEHSPLVWVVEPEATDSAAGLVRVRQVSVDVAIQGPDDSRTEVLGPRDAKGALPLKPGQLVVVEGNDRIHPDRPVKIVKRWH